MTKAKNFENTDFLSDSEDSIRNSIKENTQQLFTNGKSKKRSNNAANGCYGKRRKGPNDEKNNSGSSDKPKTENFDKNNDTPVSQPKKRGRKPKTEIKDDSNDGTTQLSDKKKYEVKCGKCDFTGTHKQFENHNFRQHVGLGWIEGEPCVNLNDEKVVTDLVKMAFKAVKKGTCELCQDVKRSVLGYVSHIRSCGKSEEEKEALKIQCQYCSAKCLPYSMPMHVKLSHPVESPNEIKVEENNETPKDSVIPSGKRRSAVKAVSKFQEVLQAINEGEADNLKMQYVLFEKGNEKLPKISPKVYNAWYKLKRENKKIPCQHEGCSTTSDDVKKAKQHFFTCFHLPDKIYLCEICNYYSVNESDIVDHVKNHQTKVLKKKKHHEADYEKAECDSEEFQSDENVDEEEDEDEVDLNDEEEESLNNSEPDSNEENILGEKPSKKNKKIKKSKKVKKDQSKCEEQKLSKVLKLFSNSLTVTLEAEKKEITKTDPWPELHTQASDWKFIEEKNCSHLLPKIKKSISVKLKGINDDDDKVKDWRRFKIFDSELIDGTTTFYTGGSVRCMSWCKVSFNRMISKTVKQYLALATTKEINHLRNVHDRSKSSEYSLIQIWDCGVLENKKSAVTAPKFSLGIAHDSEIWDMSWFPEDTSIEGSDKKISRLGILATASDDAVVRIWSICDPSQLPRADGIPIYEVFPVAKLITDEYLNDSCLNLSIGKNGLIAGGYANGILAFWSLNNISSPFNDSEGKCTVIRPHLTIQAHKTTITAVTFCPENNRFILSAALDRIVKLWDLEEPGYPIEQFSKELCLGAVWPKNLPLVIYNFDDIVSTTGKGFVRFVKDIFHDRQQSGLVMENTCLNLSFSDWLNALCGCSDDGEIKLRYFKNFLSDKRKKEQQNSISSLAMKKLNGNDNTSDADKIENENEKTVPKHYDEISSEYGLIFNNGSVGDGDGKPKKKKINPETCPVKAINTICFNPNFISFTHVAAGYNCGFVRILRLDNSAANKFIETILDDYNKKLPN